jgi:hypothetical protein
MLSTVMAVILLERLERGHIVNGHIKINNIIS